MRVFRGLIFVGLNTALFGAYCHAMVGRLQPFKFHPVKFVILQLYLGFLFVAALCGILVWIQFPEGGPRSVPLALIGAHLYGWPVFVAVLFCHHLFGRWLFGPSTGV